MDKIREGKVKELAETLRKHGLAVSMYEATEKARNILSAGTNETEKEEKNDEERFSDSDYEVSKENMPLNELMKEIGVSEEEVKEQESQKISRLIKAINDIKEEINESNSDPDKIQQIKEELSKLSDELNSVQSEMDYKKDE